MFKPKTLGLWANTDKSNFWEILPKIMDWSEQKDIQIYVTEKIQSHKKFIFDNAPKIDSSGKISEIDFMLVLGGDGTFLSCARAVRHQKTPILGIHLGDLGFLAKVTLENIFQRLDQVAEGNFLIEKGVW